MDIMKTFEKKQEEVDKKYEEISNYFIYEMENREETINLLVGPMEDFSINKSKKQKRNAHDDTSQIAA